MFYLSNLVQNRLCWSPGTRSPTTCLLRWQECRPCNQGDLDCVGLAPQLLMFPQQICEHKNTNNFHAISFGSKNGSWLGTYSGFLFFYIKFSYLLEAFILHMPVYKVEHLCIIYRYSHYKMSVQKHPEF